MNTFIKKHIHTIVLLVIIIFILINNLIWLNVDTTPISWDNANHSLIAIQLNRCIQNITSEGVYACIRITPFYPPLVHTLVALVIFLIGKNIDLIQYTNTIFFCISLISIYLFVKEKYKSKNIALTTVVLTSLTPVLFDASRYLWLEIPLICFVYFTYYFLLKSQNLSNKKYTLLAFITLSLGIVTKWYILIYLLIPFSVAFINTARNENYIKTIKKLLLGILITSIPLLIWLIPNLKDFIFFTKEYTLPDFSEPQDLISIQNFIWYLEMLIKYVIGIGFFIVWIPSYMYETKKDKVKGLNIFVIYVLLSLIGNKDFRYLYPLIPLLYTNIIYTFSKFNNKINKTILTVTVLLLITQYYLLSYRKPLNIDYQRHIKLPLFGYVPYINLTNYPVSSVNTQYWPNSDIMKDLNNIAGKDKIQVLDIIEYPSLNSINLQLEGTTKEYNNILINRNFPPFEITEGFDNPEWIKHYIQEFDYILISQNESSPDYYFFEHILDKIQNVILSNIENIGYIIKEYDYPYKEIQETLKNSKLENKESKRYEYCKNNECTKILLIKINRK